jgi:hypothetical protein
MSRLKVLVGDVFTDSDGSQMTVLGIDVEEDRVVVEDEDGNHGVMSLGDMLDEIRSGELERVDPEESEQE